MSLIQQKVAMFVSCDLYMEGSSSLAVFKATSVLLQKACMAKACMASLIGVYKERLCMQVI
jgi:hypothetical protein